MYCVFQIVNYWSEAARDKYLEYIAPRSVALPCEYKIVLFAFLAWKQMTGIVDFDLVSIISILISPLKSIGSLGTWSESVNL